MTPIHPFTIRGGANTHEEALNNALTTYDMSQALAQLKEYWDGVAATSSRVILLECRASNDERDETGPDEINPHLNDWALKGQRAWIQVRDADAEFGTRKLRWINGLLGEWSVLAKTKERAEELLQMNNNLKDPGGR